MLRCSKLPQWPHPLRHRRRLPVGHPPYHRCPRGDRAPYRAHPRRTRTRSVCCRRRYRPSVNYPSYLPNADCPSYLPNADYPSYLPNADYPSYRPSADYPSCQSARVGGLSNAPAASKSSARRVPRACTSWPDDVDASRPRRRNARITTRTSPKDDETRSRTTDGRARRDPALRGAGRGRFGCGVWCRL